MVQKNKMISVDVFLNICMTVGFGSLILSEFIESDVLCFFGLFLMLAAIFLVYRPKVRK